MPLLFLLFDRLPLLNYGFAAPYRALAENMGMSSDQFLRDLACDILDAKAVCFRRDLERN